MSVAVTINDKTSSGDLLLERIVNFPVESITVRELIETRVSQEVESYNAANGGEFRGLVQPTDSETMLNGFKLRHGQQVDVESQIQAAVHAFETSSYFLLIDNQQVAELDETLVMTPKTQVVFLRLVLLQGG